MKHGSLALSKKKTFSKQKLANYKEFTWKREPNLLFWSKYSTSNKLDEKKEEFITQIGFPLSFTKKFTNTILKNLQVCHKYLLAISLGL